MKFSKERRDSAESTIRAVLNKQEPKIWFQQHSRTRSLVPRPILQLFCIKNNDIYQLTRPVWIYLERRLNKNEDGILCSFGCDGYDLVRDLSVKLFQQYDKISVVRM